MSDQDNGRPNGEAQTVEDEGAGDGPSNGQSNGQANGHAQDGDGLGGGPASAEAQATVSGGGDELSTLRDRHLRLAAEFDNYRKRVERERAETSSARRHRCWSGCWSRWTT